MKTIQEEYNAYVQSGKALYIVYFTGQNLGAATKMEQGVAAQAMKDSDAGHVLLAQKKLGHAQYEYRAYRVQKQKRGGVLARV